MGPWSDLPVVAGGHREAAGLSRSKVAGLHPALAAIKRNLPSVARSLGFSARVTSGYRSRASQTRLYNRYIQGLQPYPVAPPGTSDHERGLALDVVSTNPDELVRLLTSAGLFWAGEDDPVHFSLVTHQRAPMTISATTTSSKLTLPKYLKSVGDIVWDMLLDF